MDKEAFSRDRPGKSSNLGEKLNTEGKAKKAAMHAAGVRTLMYGGYDDAERRMLVCIPADLPISDKEATEGLAMVLRVTKPAMSSALSHRDYRTGS